MIVNVCERETRMRTQLLADKAQLRLSLSIWEHYEEDPLLNEFSTKTVKTALSYLNTLLADIDKKIHASLIREDAEAEWVDLTTGEETDSPES